MYRATKRYDHGGSHDPSKDILEDTIAYTGRDGRKQYDVNTLLNILNYKKGGQKEIQRLEDVDSEALNKVFNPEASSPVTQESNRNRLFAFKNKDGKIRITSGNEGALNPAVGARKLSMDQLNQLSGREGSSELSSTEASELRSLLMDPAILQYFMEIQENQPRRRDFRSVNVAKGVGKKGVPGGGKGDVAGTRSLSKSQGDAGVVNFMQDFCERNSRHPSCR
mgnify:FL=1|tara:strand:- start:73 stop:741 length:669 start_codon:yes stop_codon:yes gene_type:complete